MDRSRAPRKSALWSGSLAEQPNDGRAEPELRYPVFTLEFLSQEALHENGNRTSDLAGS